VWFITIIQILAQVFSHKISCGVAFGVDVVFPSCLQDEKVFQTPQVKPFPFLNVGTPTPTPNPTPSLSQSLSLPPNEGKRPATV
jgi:hypothetical protein